MIGIYDYTVWLTYASLLSAGTGIIVSLAGMGHPYIGVFFLLFCGLCDAFDGKVARTKKNRSEFECKFGIQIDSLSDLVAFGVLPACIGEALLRNSTALAFIHGYIKYESPWYCGVLKIGFTAVLVLYVLAALIRLAYYNVTEELRQKTEEGIRTSFVGVPVTTAALLFPFIMLLQYLTKTDISLVYFVGIILLGLGFLLKIKVPKPGIRGILICLVIGFAEFLFLLFSRIFIHLPFIR